MNKYFILLAACFVFLGAQPAFAKQLVGKTFFEGKAIQLFDDGSWSYLNADTPDTASTNSAGDKCQNVTSIPVEYCYSTSYWTSSSLPTPDYDSFFANKEGSLYFGVIKEGLPLTKTYFRSAILNNAGNVAKGGRDGVKIHKDTTAQLNGDTWNYLEYSIDLDGMVFRYSNYYNSIGDKGSVQILFFTTDNVFEKYRPDMEKVANTVKVIYE